MSISFAPGADAFADLRDAELVGREARGEAGGDGGDGDRGAFQRADGGFDHLVVDADGAGGQAGHAQLFQHPGRDGLAGLGAEALDAACGVVAGKGGEVDEADRLQKPGGLVFLLHRAAAGQGGGAAFDGGGVGLHGGDPVKVQRHAGVAGMGDLGQEALGRG